MAEEKVEKKAAPKKVTTKEVPAKKDDTVKTEKEAINIVAINVSVNKHDDKTVEQITGEE